MKLCTQSTERDWHRVLDLYVDEEHELSPEINDGKTFKLLIIKSGVLHLKVQGMIHYVLAPAILLLSSRDRLQIVHTENLQSVAVYYKPTLIHDEFTKEQLYNGHIKDMVGTTVYQDYALVEPFFAEENVLKRIFSLSTDVLTTLLAMVERMNQELRVQKDGYWPCRSRSYLMQLLYYISCSYIYNHKMYVEHTIVDASIGAIIKYLHEHIGEEITLLSLTRQFHMNRNQLNGIFLKQTSMTCLAYLLHMRMDLAKIMLAETSLPIGEVGGRVGYTDTNYFTKVFKKQTSITPSDYRKHSMMIQR